MGAANTETCCDNHGYVLSLDPKTGAQQWRYDTMEDAKPIRDRGDGKMLHGPSGAPIWNSGEPMKLDAEPILSGK